MATFSATFLFFIMAITSCSSTEVLRIARGGAWQSDDFLLPASQCPNNNPKCSTFNGIGLSICWCACNEIQSQTSAFFEASFGCTLVSRVRYQAGCQLLFKGESAEERLAFLPSNSVREKDVSVPANQRCTFYYGNQFHVQYLDCTGSWRSISQQNVLDTIELTPGWSTTHLKIRIKAGTTIFQNTTAGRLVRVAIQCQTHNRVNTSSCVVFQVHGIIECPYPQPALLPGLTQATLPTPVPPATAPTEKPTTSQTTKQPTSTGQSTTPLESTKPLSPRTTTADTTPTARPTDDITPYLFERRKVTTDVLYGFMFAALALMLTILVIYMTLKRRKRRQGRPDVIAVGERGCQTNKGMETERSNENINATDTTGHHDAGQNMVLAEVAQLESRIDTETSPNYLTLNSDYAPMHPITLSREVSRENVIIDKIIGKGAFGQVAQGKILQLRRREETVTVAIKMLKDNTTESERKDLLSELEVMKKLQPHPYVITLLGCVTESDHSSRPCRS